MFCAMLHCYRWNIHMTRLLNCWKFNWYKLPTKYKVIAILDCYQLCVIHVGIVGGNTQTCFLPYHFSSSFLFPPSFLLSIRFLIFVPILPTEFSEDLFHLRGNSITVEVSMARLFNHSVKIKKQNEAQQAALAAALTNDP